MQTAVGQKQRTLEDPTYMGQEIQMCHSMQSKIQSVFTKQESNGMSDSSVCLCCRVSCQSAELIFELNLTVPENSAAPSFVQLFVGHCSG